MIFSQKVKLFRFTVLVRRIALAALSAAVTMLENGDFALYTFQQSADILLMSQ